MMKNFKLLFIAILAITFISCDSDDDSNTLTNDTPTVSFDVDAVIALPAFSDITSLVTVNGQPAADYLSELEVGARLILERPDGLLVSDILLYDFLVVFDTEGIEIGFDNNLLSSDSNLSLIVPDGEPSDYYGANGFPDFETGVPTIIIEAVDNDQTDVDYKYEFDITIERGGTVFGPYTIDPKIRIKSLN